MRLRRVEVRNFRRLDHPVCIDGIGDGLTIVGGDNEDGKSTLLSALKAGLFEHHGVGGAIREAMSPHDGAVPEVAVSFEHAGQRYDLRKAFRRGGASLAGPQGKLADDAAEQRLQELLRFERRQGRSRVEPQHHGLQAVFWLDQGTSFGGFEALAGGRERLSGAIEAEVGGVSLGERGRQLLDLVEREAGTYWTDRGKARGPLAEAAQTVEACKAELDGLRARKTRYDRQVDRLDQLRAERRRFRETDELGRARASLERCRQDLGAIEKLEAQQAQSRADAAARTAEWQRLEAQAAGRAAKREQLARLRQDLAQGERERAEAAEECRRREARLAAADTREQQLVAAWAEVEQAWIDADRRQKLATIAAELARLAADHRRAHQAQDAVGRLQAAQAGNPASPKRIDAIREAERVCSVAEAALKAVATRIELMPEGGARAKLGGRELDPSVPLHITEPTELELPPFGRIRLVPGAGDLDVRRRACSDARARLAAALAELGVPDAVAAQALLDRRAALELELREQQTVLAAVLQSHGCPDLAALDTMFAELTGRCEQLRGSAQATSQAGEPAAVLAELAERRIRLQAEREAARHETGVLAAEARVANEASARLDARVAELRRQIEAADALLAEEDAARSEDELRAQLEAALAARDRSAQRQAQLERQLATADPEMVRERLGLAERRVGALEAEQRRLDEAVREVEIELRTQGAEGLGERVAELEDQLQAAQADQERLLGHARAWRLLRQELTAAASAARDALLSPVMDRLRPALTRLFPDAEAVLDPETLALTHLRRSGLVERYDQLSVGTREQIAVLVRLALARLLLEREGEAPCVILDDALVYADERRFDLMKTILQQAARELQILVLTCRPRDYLGLDARHLRLVDCRASSGAA
jgi:DNA repair exonuclease SbcCD ATPase subunit